MKLNLHQITQSWPKDKEGWSIAPYGLLWINGDSAVKIGETVLADPVNLSIGDLVEIGDGTVIHSNVTIENYVNIKDAVLLHEGCIISAHSKLEHMVTVAQGVSVGRGCRIGRYTRIGQRCQIANWCNIGDNCAIGSYVVLKQETTLPATTTLGEHAQDPINIGWAEGYQKVIAQVHGVAYISAGCRWFTLAQALEHWANRQDRPITLALMQAAKAIADAKGWKYHIPTT